MKLDNMASGKAASLDGKKNPKTRPLCNDSSAKNQPSPSPKQKPQDKGNWQGTSRSSASTGPSSAVRRRGSKTPHSHTASAATRNRKGYSNSGGNNVNRGKPDYNPTREAGGSQVVGAINRKSVMNAVEARRRRVVASLQYQDGDTEMTAGNHAYGDHRGYDQRYDYGRRRDHGMIPATRSNESTSGEDPVPQQAMSNFVAGGGSDCRNYRRNEKETLHRNHEAKESCGDHQNRTESEYGHHDPQRIASNEGYRHGDNNYSYDHHHHHCFNENDYSGRHRRRGFNQGSHGGWHGHHQRYFGTPHHHNSVASHNKHHHRMQYPSYQEHPSQYGQERNYNRPSFNHDQQPPQVAFSEPKDETPSPITAVLKSGVQIPPTLNEIEAELAILLEESYILSGNRSVDWSYVRTQCGQVLRSKMDQHPDFNSLRLKIPFLVRSKSAQCFNLFRETVKKAMQDPRSACYVCSPEDNDEQLENLVEKGERRNGSAQLLYERKISRGDLENNSLAPNSHGQNQNAHPAGAILPHGRRFILQYGDGKDHRNDSPPQHVIIPNSRSNHMQHQQPSYRIPAAAEYDRRKVNQLTDHPDSSSITSNQKQFYHGDEYHEERAQQEGYDSSRWNPRAGNHPYDSQHNAGASTNNEKTPMSKEEKRAFPSRKQATDKDKIKGSLAPSAVTQGRSTDFSSAKPTTRTSGVSSTSNGSATTTIPKGLCSENVKASAETTLSGKKRTPEMKPKQCIDATPRSRMPQVPSDSLKEKSGDDSIGSTAPHKSMGKTPADSPSVGFPSRKVDKVYHGALAQEEKDRMKDERGGMDEMSSSLSSSSSVSTAVSHSAEALPEGESTNEISAILFVTKRMGNRNYMLGITNLGLVWNAVPLSRQQTMELKAKYQNTIEGIKYLDENLVETMGLSYIEVELALVLEEYCFSTGRSNTVDWSFIHTHASDRLLAAINKFRCQSEIQLEKSALIRPHMTDRFTKFQSKVNYFLHHTLIKHEIIESRCINFHINEGPAPVPEAAPSNAQVSEVSQDTKIKIETGERVFAYWIQKGIGKWYPGTVQGSRSADGSEKGKIKYHICFANGLEDKNVDESFVMLRAKYLRLAGVTEENIRYLENLRPKGKNAEVSDDSPSKIEINASPTPNSSMADYENATHPYTIHQRGDRVYALNGCWSKGTIVTPIKVSEDPNGIQRKYHIFFDNGFEDRNVEDKFVKTPEEYYKMNEIDTQPPNKKKSSDEDTASQEEADGNSERIVENDNNHDVSKGEKLNVSKKGLLQNVGDTSTDSIPAGLQQNPNTDTLSEKPKRNTADTNTHDVSIVEPSEEVKSSPVLGSRSDLSDSSPIELRRTNKDTSSQEKSEEKNDDTNCHKRSIEKSSNHNQKGPKLDDCNKSSDSDSKPFELQISSRENSFPLDQTKEKINNTINMAVSSIETSSQSKEAPKPEVSNRSSDSGQVNLQSSSAQSENKQAKLSAEEQNIESDGCPNIYTKKNHQCGDRVYASWLGEQDCCRWYLGTVTVTKMKKNREKEIRVYNILFDNGNEEKDLEEPFVMAYSDYVSNVGKKEKEILYQRRREGKRGTIFDDQVKPKEEEPEPEPEPKNLHLKTSTLHKCGDKVYACWVGEGCPKWSLATVKDSKVLCKGTNEETIRYHVLFDHGKEDKDLNDKFIIPYSEYLEVLNKEKKSEEPEKRQNTAGVSQSTQSHDLPESDHPQVSNDHNGDGNEIVCQDNEVGLPQPSISSNDFKQQRNRVFEPGERVYACWLVQGNCRWYPGTIMSSSTCTKRRRKGTRTYHVLFDDGDEDVSLDGMFIMDYAEYLGSMRNRRSNNDQQAKSLPSNKGKEIVMKCREDGCQTTGNVCEQVSNSSVSCGGKRAGVSETVKESGHVKKKQKSLLS